MPDRKDFDRLRKVVGARLKELRRSRGLSQEELADQAGCHRTYIGMIERGEGNPSLEILSRIAGALGVEVIEFLG